MESGLEGGHSGFHSGDIYTPPAASRNYEVGSTMIPLYATLELCVPWSRDPAGEVHNDRTLCTSGPGFGRRGTQR